MEQRTLERMRVHAGLTPENSLQEGLATVATELRILVDNALMGPAERTALAQAELTVLRAVRRARERTLRAARGAAGRGMAAGGEA